MAAGDLYIRINFQSIPSVDDSITVIANFDGNPVPMLMVFKTIRTDVGEVSIGSTLHDTVVNYAEAFNNDIPDFQATVDGNSVIIENIGIFFDYMDDCVIVGDFATAGFPQQNNVIHVINFTPKVYAVPAAVQKNFLITEDNDFLTTESGDKIRL